MIARISNDFGPQDPADGDGYVCGPGTRCSPGEDCVAYGGSGSTGGNHCVPDCVPDCVPELLGVLRDTEESLPVAGDVALPEMSPVVFAGTSAVPVSVPAVAGAVSSAVFAGGGGVAADAAPPANRGTVNVGVTVLTDTGSALPANLLESVRVTEDCLSVDITLPKVSPAIFAGAAAVPVSLHVITGVEIMFPTSELPDVHVANEDGAIAPRDVPAVFGTMCYRWLGYGYGSSSTGQL